MLRLATSAFRTIRPTIATPGPFAGLGPSMLLPEASFLAPLQVRWAKKSKRKKRKKRADRTAEQKAITAGAADQPWLHVFEPANSFQMARTIKKHMHGLISDGRHNVRRKKDLNSYTSYRVKRIAGLTHDNPQENVDRRGFVTPLTQLQDGSSLPRSPLGRRFRFPHTLSYKVYWGPPSVMDEPNINEGSMVGCTLAARLEDLPLTQRQKERLLDIIGADRFDEETGVFVLEADVFPDRNHNAALLGDMVEQLLREALSADDVFATVPDAVADAMVSEAEAAAAAAVAAMKAQASE